MSAWLLSVVGIVSAGVLLDILLPDGDMAKYAKGVFALIVVLVLVSPIASVVSDGSLADALQGATQIEADGAFLDSLDRDREQADEEKVQAALQRAGYETESVNIFAAATQSYSPQRVNVKMQNFGELTDEQKSEIENIVKSAVACEEVRIYG